MRDEEFQVLLQGVREAVEHYQGLRTDLRTTILPAPPEPAPDAVEPRSA